MRVAVLGRKARQREIVQVDEPVQQLARWIDLDGEPPLREVDLHAVGALPQAVPDFRLVLAQEVFDELLAGVPGDLLGRVHQAQGRGGDDGLLHRPMRVLERQVEVAVRIRLVAEGPARQPKHAPDVARGERDLEPVRSGVGKPLNAVGPEVVDICAARRP